MFLPENEFDVVVIGASLGGAPVLRTLLSILPEGFPASVIIVQHVSSATASLMPYLLQRHCAMPVRHAVSGEVIQPSNVYVAAPGKHLTLKPGGRLDVSDGDRVNFARPAIDPLFFSAAAVYGERSIGVILTGRLRDGTAGGARLRQAGGVLLVQSPESCIAPSMPEASIASGADFVLSPRQIGSALISLVQVPGVAGLFGVGRHHRAA